MSSGNPQSHSDDGFAVHAGDESELSPNSEHWVSLEEAGDRLGLPLNHVKLAIDQGLLQGLQAKDGSWLVFIKTAVGGVSPQATEPSSQVTHARRDLEADFASEDARRLERELRLEAREDRLVTLLQQSLENREDQLADKDKLLGELSRQSSDLARDLARERNAQSAAQVSVTDAQRNFDPARYDQALANIRETLRLVRDYLLEQK